MLRSTGTKVDKTYLFERPYRVMTGGRAESEVINLDCGLPQGSSLGPLKFIAYAAEMEEVVNRHGIFPRICCRSLVSICKSMRSDGKVCNG